MAVIFIGRPTFGKGSSKKYDVIVYGGNGAAIMAAIAAKQSGALVLLLSPDQHLGGVTSSGLGWTDIGNPEAIGGLAKEFYHRIYLHYQKPSSWKSGDQKQYEKSLYGIYKVKDSLMWTFEPHVAEAIFNQMLLDYKVPVKKGVRINRNRPLVMNAEKISAIQMTDGKRYKAEIYIDASYEGDLMAMAGVSFTVGREANDQYGETINGIEKTLAVKNNLQGVLIHTTSRAIPQAACLAGVQAEIQGVEGQADNKLQAYCYRICMTDDPNNRIKVTRPAGYKKSDFALSNQSDENGRGPIMEIIRSSQQKN